MGPDMVSYTSPFSPWRRAAPWLPPRHRVVHTSGAVAWTLGKPMQFLEADLGSFG